MSESDSIRQTAHCGDLLPLYVARVLPDVQMAAVRRHLDECAPCREAAREWGVVDAAVRAEARARMSALPPLKVMDRVRQEASASGAWTGAWRRRPDLVLPLVTLAALLVMVVIWPVGLQAAAAGIEGLVQQLLVGRHTVVEQVDAERMAQVTPTLAPTLPAALSVTQEGNELIIRTAEGALTREPIPEGREATVRRFSSLDEVRRAAPQAVQQPDYLPTGYLLREALLTPLDHVYLFYDGPQGGLVLMQMRVGETGHALDANVEMLTDQPIEALVMDGRQAGWVAGRSLIWEAEGINYILEGPHLTRDEAIRIARSLR